MPSAGMGIRRTVLVEQLARRAEELGAVLRPRCAVNTVEAKRDHGIVHTEQGPIAARLIVAADGLHSSMRRAASLDASPDARRRFAVRQHYDVRPWSDYVEVYVDAKGEAVATPVSDRCVAVNFVWEDGAIERPTLPLLANRFPALKARLAGAPATSSIKSAGPMAQRARRRNANRIVLVGDAAGFVDSISGDGLSIAFNSALILGRHLKEILARGASRDKSLIQNIDGQSDDLLRAIILDFVHGYVLDQIASY